MKIILLILIIVLTTFLVAGCMAGPNESVNSPDEEGNIAGFWTGLWQGFISPVTFIISLFSDTINFYEVHNNGNWYNFGFILGVFIIFGGGGGGAARRRR